MYEFFPPPVHFTRKTKYAGFNYVIGVTEAAAGTKVLQGQLWFVLLFHPVHGSKYYRPGY